MPKIQVLNEALNRIFKLENSCRKSKGKNFIRDSGKLMERFQHLVPRCRTSMKQDYDDFMLFMDGLRSCIEKGIYQVLQTRRVIIDKTDCVFRAGKKFTYEYDDKKDQLSFYIQEYILNSHIDESKDQEFSRDEINITAKGFYNILITTGGMLQEADNEHVFDMNYFGVVSFLDFLRLTFIYEHILKYGFNNIKVCQYGKCKKLFLSKIQGNIRGRYCSQQCYKKNLTEDVVELRKCQNKMRIYYENFINKHSHLFNSNAIINIKPSIRTYNCSECKYKNNPSRSSKGDCWQILKNLDIAVVVEKVKKQEQIPKKSVK